MRIISTHDGLLRTLDAAELPQAPRGAFVTGLPALDAVAPAGGFARGAVHELLSRPGQPAPLTPAALLAQAIQNPNPPSGVSIENRTSKFETSAPWILWSDPCRRLYPPALARFISLDRLILLRPPTPADEIWAITEALRCRAIGAAVASFARLSRVEARRLQLAAERGGGAGIFLRPLDRFASTYAAATRWLVEPASPASSSLKSGGFYQRWMLQLLHGHGGQLSARILLEVCRETDRVRATEVVVDRPAQATPALARSA